MAVDDLADYRRPMRIVLACMVVAVLAPAEATMANNVIGAGIDSCGRWTADRQPVRGVSAAQDEQWVLGFLSAIGYATADGPLDGVDAQAVLAWVDNYCRANPLDHIMDAAHAFYQAHPR